MSCTIGLFTRSQVTEDEEKVFRARVIQHRAQAILAPFKRKDHVTGTILRLGLPQNIRNRNLPGIGYELRGHAVIFARRKVFESVKLAQELARRVLHADGEAPAAL